MESYSRVQLKNLKNYLYDKRTENSVKYIYDFVIRSAKHGLTSTTFDIQYIYDDTYIQNNYYNTLYVYDANQANNIVVNLKEYFYDAKIEFIQRSIIGEDKIYINWE